MPDTFTCPRCGSTSHNPHDVAEGYCGHCHDWTGQPRPDLALTPGMFDGIVSVDLETPATLGIPPSQGGRPPWKIFPALVGWVATNGLRGAWAKTETEARMFVQEQEGEENLEWGAIMQSLDRLTGKSYACRHEHHHDCPVPDECGCPCHGHTMAKPTKEAPDA
ncbi:MAG: hypothetical protein FWF90_16160 [Promicromonosporaceae bacterium]|nr:hypothetical protein [Promicromonosporaceae bacterium]